ncbi:tryptophan-rich sensory protein [Polaribacter sp. BAL334]|uniref:TspO/MBR family protein n=1 Tax=Polaribacter sp. BAL334 TaxID=1708178 RepID=UPI0018D225AD|nr:TspO/MBR family protein [Polaribacter sp. BAL334]MBG7613204.1 tryptophan-rich sensory protein [Polaribacter sp. BAL334]
MKQISFVFIFLAINFGGLAIGSFLMNEGPTSDWYSSLNKAPWTPPGWVFGVAWTTIMICFSIYLAKLFTSEINKKLIFSIFLIEFILNVSWNYLFFNQHLVFTALIGIVLLTAVIFYFYFNLSKNIGKYKYLLLPYMVWLCIATSLNLYVLVHN